MTLCLTPNAFYDYASFGSSAQNSPRRSRQLSRKHSAMAAPTPPFEALLLHEFILLAIGLLA